MKLLHNDPPQITMRTYLIMKLIVPSVYCPFPRSKTRTRNRSNSPGGGSKGPKSLTCRAAGAAGGAEQRQGGDAQAKGAAQEGARAS
eukprot:7376025-Prymnesium_polylepis.2